MKILEGENLQKIIVALVVVLGGGNLWELSQAIREIHEVHAVLDEAMTRQKQMAASIEELKKNGNR